MAQHRLSPEEVRKRLIRLRNLEYLHENQRFKIWGLRDENRELRKEVSRLKVVVNEQQKTIEDLKLQMEELRTIVFGKKKKKKDIDDDTDDTPSKAKTPRSSSSYKRPAPKDDETTEIQNHPLDTCPCGAELTEKQIVVFYEEDIPMPTKKIVRKHIVEKAYCPNCQKWHTSIPLPNHRVVLGENVQKYICYLNIFCRLSFGQIQYLLSDTYNFAISQGEIVKILNREALKLRPFYERLRKQIQGEPVVHLDETGWRLFIDQDRSYAWVMSGAQSQESVFLVGESRGKGNADKLLGKNFNGFVVSDDYVAYKKLKNHQLCWAHLIRKFRDLAKSNELKEDQRSYCQKEYSNLCVIYNDLQQDRSKERYDEFSQRLTKLSVTRSADSRKLARLKMALRGNIQKYLTCLEDPRIPLTNNQAERSLRHLVLKRKISFGSLTKKTADNLAILSSVILSLRQRYQSNFFREYLRV